MRTYFAVMALFITVLILSSGCAHRAMRGTVAMKVSDQEAHVCMGDDEVKAGDKVALFKNECTGTNTKEGSGRSCRKVRIGDGEVTRTLNEHYSLVRVGSDVKFEEGTIVEKL